MTTDYDTEEQRKIEGPRARSMENCRKRPYRKKNNSKKNNATVTQKNDDSSK